MPFEYLEHFVAAPVTAGGRETRFVFDSGIGPTLLSEKLAAELGCVPTGASFTGRRMSGQRVTVPLATLDSLAVAGYRRDGLTVGVFDMSAFRGFDGIGGFLSLDFFRETPVTVDYGTQQLLVGERSSAPGSPCAWSTTGRARRSSCRSTSDRARDRGRGSVTFDRRTSGC